VVFSHGLRLAVDGVDRSRLRVALGVSRLGICLLGISLLGISLLGVGRLGLLDVLNGRLRGDDDILFVARFSEAGLLGIGDNNVFVVLCVRFVGDFLGFADFLGFVGFFDSSEASASGIESSSRDVSVTSPESSASPEPASSRVQLSPCVRRPHRSMHRLRPYPRFPSPRRFFRLCVASVDESETVDCRAGQRPRQVPIRAGRRGVRREDGKRLGRLHRAQHRVVLGDPSEDGNVERLRDRVDRAVVCGGRGVEAGDRDARDGAAEPLGQLAGLLGVAEGAPLRRRDEKSLVREPERERGVVREPRAGVHKHVVGVVERGDDLPEPGGGGRRVRLEVRRAGDDAEAGRTCVNRVGDRPLPPARREG